jgi:signal transduction histidine kinase/ligand-binding sensor domain-containing protein
MIGKIKTLLRSAARSVSSILLMNCLSKNCLKIERGNIWIMTEERGLYRFNPTTKQIKAFLPSSSNLVSFSLDVSGQLWVAATNELYVYQANSDSFQPTFIHNNLHLKPETTLLSILIDARNNLWVGTYEDGVYVASLTNEFLSDKGKLLVGEIAHFQQGNTVKHLSSNQITCLMNDKSGRIWIGTRTGGISIYNPDSKSFTSIQHSGSNPQSLAENFVWSLFEDRQKIIWIGLSSHGIDKYDPLKFQFHLIQQDVDAPRNTLPDDMIFAIYAHQNDLYIGTETGGIARYSLATKRFVPFLTNTQSSASFLTHEVRAITSDADKNLWIANTQGLGKYDPVRRIMSTYPLTHRKPLYLFSAQAISNQSGGQEIWIGEQGGLWRFDLTTKRWKDWKDNPAVAAISGYTVRLIKEDSLQNVWLGTLGHGLLRYDPATKGIMVFDRKNGLPCNNIRSLLEDGKWLWVGTDCGLFQLDLQRLHVVKHYTKSDGLPNEVIYGILKDNAGYLWLSSNKGLAQFSPTRGSIKTYDLSDGLQSDEFNTNVCYRHTDGTLFFGGVHGINYFNASELKRNVLVPPVKITAVTVLDSARPPNQKQLTLNYDQNFIGFEFATLNFSNTEKNKYQYKLKGIDPDWVNAQHRRYANYTKLPAGNYVFRVRGSNDDGIWNEQGASIIIVIKPPFWETLWFRIVLLVLLIGGMYGVYQYRIFQLKSRQAQELNVAIRTQELERQRLAKELHDGVGANLAVLKMYLASLGNPTIPTEELKKRSMAILKASLDDIRSIIHDMHPRSLAELGLAQTIAEMAMLINESKRLNVAFVTNNVPQKLSATIEINMFRVVQELLQNAIKHAEASTVWLNLDHESGALSLTYRDNGRGLDTTLAERASGNGLVNIRQRIALLKGTYQMTSAEKQGMSIQIQVPTTAS